METSFSSTKTWLASSPASTRHDSSGRGTCSWTSFDLKYVGDNEVFSVYPGKNNNPGDLIKGCTFRRLNVTRKISIKDVPSLIKTALDMVNDSATHTDPTQRRTQPKLSHAHTSNSATHTHRSNSATHTDLTPSRTQIQLICAHKTDSDTHTHRPEPHTLASKTPCSIAPCTAPSSPVICPCAP